GEARRAEVRLGGREEPSRVEAPVGIERAHAPEDGARGLRRELLIDDRLRERAERALGRLEREAERPDRVDVPREHRVGRLEGARRAAPGGGGGGGRVGGGSLVGGGGPPRAGGVPLAPGPRRPRRPRRRSCPRR